MKVVFRERSLVLHAFYESLCLFLALPSARTATYDLRWSGGATKHAAFTLRAPRYVSQYIRASIPEAEERKKGDVLKRREERPSFHGE